MHVEGGGAIKLIVVWPIATSLWSEGFIEQKCWTLAPATEAQQMLDAKVYEFSSWQLAEMGTKEMASLPKGKEGCSPIGTITKGVAL